MRFQTTTAVNKILKLKKRLKVVQGGSSAGKTIAILLIFIDKAQNTKNKLFSVVSETLPHLRRGAMRDFLNIMESHGYYNENSWNRSEFIYTFSTGSKIEFFSADQPSKVRGLRRNTLFINECNNISYETYTQLAIRTDEEIFLDYNPVYEFWVHTEIIGKLEHDFIILTYNDNEALPDSIKKEIESRKSNFYFWKVYGLGELGEIEGKIYKNWQIIDEIPYEARIERYGLDFGYTNDPTSIIAIYYYNGGYIFDEVTFTKGLSNRQIADILVNLNRALVIADSAEPKSIDELKSYKVNVLPAQKGKDSVRNGIQAVQDQKISITKKSLNIIKEYRNYLWQQDKNGEFIEPNTPEHAISHTMDAIRYGMSSLISVIRRRQELDMVGVKQRQPKLTNPGR